MLIIVDAKISSEAKTKLSSYGNLLEIATSGITNSYLSGHSDIFFCQSGSELICAKNLPQKYFKILKENNIKYNIGKTAIRKDYPGCIPYNAVITEEFLIHNLKYTDKTVLNNVLNKEKINTSQGFTKCSLVEIKKNIFVTSDKGIYKKLNRKCKDIVYVETFDIKLSEMEYGFIGGTCGVFQNKFFINGSLKNFSEGKKLEDFLTKHSLKLVELSATPLIDVGSIIFV